MRHVPRVHGVNVGADDGALKKTGILQTPLQMLLKGRVVRRHFWRQDRFGRQRARRGFAHDKIGFGKFNRVRFDIRVCHFARGTRIGGGGFQKPHAVRIGQRAHCDDVALLIERRNLGIRPGAFEAREKFAAFRQLHRVGGIDGRRRLHAGLRGELFGGGDGIAARAYGQKNEIADGYLYAAFKTFHSVDAFYKLLLRGGRGVGSKLDGDETRVDRQRNLRALKIVIAGGGLRGKRSACQDEEDERAQYAKPTGYRK
ncbi:MAG: hypothetical protein DCC52_15115 [Chloroflexi bacterium]|nr:MAG: hypothetical protein DCC52_15115 [Chloroflexota bacterium]